MRTLIKYISLLIISGLIIPFCQTMPTRKPNSTVIQADAGDKCSKIVSDTPQMQYFDLWYILEFALPVLKK